MNAKLTAGDPSYRPAGSFGIYLPEIIVVNFQGCPVPAVRISYPDHAKHYPTYTPLHRGYVNGAEVPPFFRILPGSSWMIRDLLPGETIEITA